MAGMAKRLRSADLQLLKQLRRKRLQAIWHDSLFLTVCLGMILLGRINIAFYKGAVSHLIQFNLSFAYVIVGFIGVYLALAPLCSLFIRIFWVHALPRVLQWQNILFLNLYLLVNIPIALLIITIWKPVLPIQDFHFLYIAIACIFATIVTCVLLFLTRHALPLPRFSQTIRQIVIGIMLAALLFFVFELLMPFARFSFPFNNTQLWQSSILLVMLWPTFLLHESVVHNWAERGTLFAFLLSLSFRVCFLAVVYVFVTLSQEKNFIDLVWPIPVVVFLFLQYCCFVLYRKGRAAVAGATLSACIMAWTLTSHLVPVNL